MCFTREGIYIVNGKEIKIDYENIDNLSIDILNKLESEKMTQLDALYIRKNIHSLFKAVNKVSEALEEAKETQKNQYDVIIQKIEYVSNKTIFGYLKNSYEKHPIKTIILLSFFSFIFFVTLMRIFDITSFNDFINVLKNWLPK